MQKRQPGQVRDAIIAVMRQARKPCTVSEIREAVIAHLNGDVAASSVRSYLGINTGKTFRRVGHGTYELRKD